MIPQTYVCHVNMFDKDQRIFDENGFLYLVIPTMKLGNVLPLLEKKGCKKFHLYGNREFIEGLFEENDLNNKNIIIEVN